MDMRVYISADLEGVLGVTSPHQCFPVGDASGYHQAVNQLTIELKTVIDALTRHQVSHITVNDAHGYMINLSPLHFGDNITLITGKPKPCAMSTGLDNTYDLAMYVGYHSKAGTLNGVLCHTFHDQIADLQINGVSLGESGMNALYAGVVHHVPVALLSGDDAVCAEFSALSPGTHCISTKAGLSFSAACHRPWQAVQQDYKTAVDAIMASYTTESKIVISPVTLASLTLLSMNHASLSNAAHTPNTDAAKGFTLQVTFTSTQAADKACIMPWISRVNGCSVTVSHPDLTFIYKALQSLYAIVAYPATPAASHLD
jgi:D-amino peptidase